MTNQPLIPPIAPARRPSTSSGQRFVKRGFYLCCVECGLAQEWCGCAKAPPPPPTSGDGESSDLTRRIREVTGGR